MLIDDRESCAADASALADCAGIVKQQTMIKCTVALQKAVSNNLVDLSGYLLSDGLITPSNRRELTNQHTAVNHRAAKLVEIIQEKVQLDHTNYNKFIDILKKADSVYYSEILTILSGTLHEGNYGNYF